MTIIEQIKAEIDRRIEAIAKAPSDNGVMDSINGARGHELMKLLSFISTIEKECQWSTEDETKIAYICDVMSGKELVSDISPSYRSEIIEFAKSLQPTKVKSEKPMNQDGLVEEIERWDSDNADDNGFYNRIDFARHFAKWGAEHLKK